MPGRPFWSGQLRISLVSFPIQLFPASVPRAGMSFHLLDRRSGERIRHLNVAGHSERPVPNQDIVKGYEYRKGKYLTLEPGEIAKLRIETNKVLEIRQFIEIGELSPDLFDRPYFVVPGTKDAKQAFAVVERALAESGRAGIGEVTFGGREHLVAIEAPRERTKLGLMAYLLRYRDEMRASADYFVPLRGVKVDRRELAMAGELVAKYRAPFRWESFRDDYEDALRALLAAKRNQEPLPAAVETRRAPKVVSLMDALRDSVSQTKAAGAGKRNPSRAGRGKGPVLVGGNKRRRQAA